MVRRSDPHSGLGPAKPAPRPAPRRRLAVSQGQRRPMALRLRAPVVGRIGLLPDAHAAIDQ
jgi:hypothetical protein